MVLSRLFLALGGLALAAGAAIPSFNTSDVTGTNWLLNGNVLLWGHDGRTQAITHAEWEELKTNLTVGPPPPPPNWNVTRPARNDTHGLQARGACEGIAELQILETQTFVNWDVQVSPVVGNQYDQAYVSMAEGYSISNAIAISIQAWYGPLSKVLTLVLGVTYTRTWTTSTTETIADYVPAGLSGLIVSNPVTVRRYGNYIEGCYDDPTYNWYSADEQIPHTYQSVDWVQGAFRLCASKDYPVPFCEGNGFHY
ncbi:uncharacterized protein N7482_009029 [Penicillium canariense]|uniref:Uncharacterized protein n=1 Tax=Penicillium canariense TaxID=189055 RepID=A0A9W9HX57_9EURO|nr:uncharacterized protein N7482_009029 [Penicillium canariense]KAJ5157929.1 hypothetical protein N7482_009029 [Penicillium canariense]